MLCRTCRKRVQEKSCAGCWAISNRMHTGDITTLANPDIVEQIREIGQGRAATPLADGPTDIKLFGEER